MTTDNQPGYAAQLCRIARTYPDRPAVVLDQDMRSYRQLVKAGRQRARELRALGLGQGDKVALLMPNCIDFIEFFVGASMLGVVVVPVNTRFRAFELGHILRDSGAACVITTGAVDEHVNFKTLLLETLPGLGAIPSPDRLKIDGFPALRHIVHVGADAPASMLCDSDLRDRAGAFDAPTEDLFPTAEDLQLVIYTSGTTAAPKGCLLPNRCLTITAGLTADLFKIGPDDTWWCPLPMFHIGGLLFMSVCLMSGACFVGMGHFDIAEAFRQFREDRPTVLYPLFPTIALPIIESPLFPQTDFSQVRYVFDVGPEKIQNRLQDAFPDAILLSAFGMSETTGIVTFNHPTDAYADRMTTVGRLMPGWSARIVDPETRQDVDPGQPGEIAVKGPGLFAGYLNQPDLTRGAFTDDGYFLTGDYGAFTSGGVLRFLGRLKDQMKVGGENVSALEVESFLAQHPGVRLAQVVSIPDEKYGEVAAAFIEEVPGAGITQDEILAFCKGRIASFKVPRFVRVVTQWPMSATKIAKFRLREQLLKEVQETKSG